MTWRRSHAGAGDRGTADALTVVVLAPVAVAAAVLVGFLGRQVDAQAQVRWAAMAAADAAAAARSPYEADATARRVAERAIGSECARVHVAIDVAEFEPGGSVRVMIRCEVARRNAELALAPARTVTATAAASVDRFRAVEAVP